MDDPRLTPARATCREISRRQGQGQALRHRRGIRGGRAIARCAGASSDAALMTQALKGERVTIYDRNGEGGPGANSTATAMSAGFPTARWRSPAGRRPTRSRRCGLCLSRPLDQAATGRDAGDGGTAVAMIREEGDFAVTREGWICPRQHLGGNDRHRAGFRHGGRTLRRHAVSVGRQVQPRDRLLRPRPDGPASRGTGCPRDSDMQEADLGRLVGHAGAGQPAARRSDVLGGPRRDRPRCRRHRSR